MANSSPPGAAEGLKIREARSDDLDSVLKIEFLCFGQGAYSEDLLRLYLALSPKTLLMAEMGGAVVGYVIGLTKRWGEGHVLSLAVHPDYRRRGVATALMKELLERFKSEGARAARLEVQVSNKAAINLYRKLGFKTISVARGYYPDGKDAYLMVATLR